FTEANGHSIGNHFFWAINRSQDFTFTHDWFSKVGEGFGGEYRYALNGGTGRADTYFLDKHEVAYDTGVTPANKSFNINATAIQQLPNRFRLQASASYFSDIVNNQTFNSNLEDFSNNRRTFGVNLSGNIKNYSTYML